MSKSLAPLRAFYTGVAVTFGAGVILGVATANLYLGAALGLVLGLATFVLLNRGAKKERARS